jgi:hypothetical protein
MVARLQDDSATCGDHGLIGILQILESLIFFVPK